MNKDYLFYIGNDEPDKDYCEDHGIYKCRECFVYFDGTFVPGTSDHIAKWNGETWNSLLSEDIYLYEPKETEIENRYHCNGCGSVHTESEPKEYIRTVECDICIHCCPIPEPPPNWYYYSP